MVAGVFVTILVSASWVGATHLMKDLFLRRVPPLPASPPSPTSQQVMDASYNTLDSPSMDYTQDFVPSQPQASPLLSALSSNRKNSYTAAVFGVSQEVNFPERQSAVYQRRAHGSSKLTDPQNSANLSNADGNRKALNETPNTSVPYIFRFGFADPSEYGPYDEQVRHSVAVIITVHVYNA